MSNVSNLTLYNTKVHSRAPFGYSQNLEPRFLAWLQANFSWLQVLAEYYLIETAAPTVSNKAQVGALWLNTSNATVYINSGTANVPIWTQISIPRLAVADMPAIPRMITWP